ncbi:N-acetyltransferase [Mycena maculata]|uniref:N-acetyltransferase n=1 Tax=Mycena maculata TaxID=230809 RepID=A0AAD7I6A1_9AGAR|nr:N-acetyltransferase [Mycena maculata]
MWILQYSPSYYLNYLARWPDLCCATVAPNGRMMGYIFGKAEGPSHSWHGHITILTVAPPYRLLRLASTLIARLEAVSDEAYRALFVDLYVRCTNDVAIAMYERLGYSVYRRVREYYEDLGGGRGRDEEDAFDMRKPLSRDPGRRSVRANGRDVLVSREEVS